MSIRALLFDVDGTLADTEEAGAKNIIREKLVNAYNQALGHKVVEQIYFSDFVVQ